MSDPNADFKSLLELTGGVEVRSAEHPDDRSGIYQQSCPPVMPCEATS